MAGGYEGTASRVVRESELHAEDGDEKRQDASRDLCWWVRAAGKGKQDSGERGGNLLRGPSR